MGARGIGLGLFFMQSWVKPVVGSELYLGNYSHGFI